MCSFFCRNHIYLDFFKFIRYNIVNKEHLLLIIITNNNHLYSTKHSHLPKICCQDNTIMYAANLDKQLLIFAN